MKNGHGKMVMAIMALVMASLACSVEWDGEKLQAPSMTATPVPTPSMTETNAPEPACLIVRALPGGDGNLNLRSGAGTSYAVITVLQDGQALVMDGQRGGWYQVSTVMDGVSMTGFVNSEYVEACK